MLSRALLPSVVALVVGVLVAGCGDGADRDPTAEPTPRPRDGSVEHCSTQSTVHFLRGEQLGVAHRLVDLESDDCGAATLQARAALRELLRGPSAADEEAGLGTAIPAGTELRDVDVADGMATVDLSRAFASGGGSASMSLRVAQVVATLTAISGVERVAFELDGESAEAIGGEGVVVAPPRARTDIEAATPAILVEDPAPGDCVADYFAAEDDGQLHVGGTANVFEAQLHVELERDGKVVEREIVTATSGTGTRGTFETTLPTEQLDAAAPATLVAFTSSPRDGARENVVRIELDTSC